MSQSWLSTLAAAALAEPSKDAHSLLTYWRAWLPLALLVLVMIAWRLNRGTLWHRLAELYPSASPRTSGRRLFASRVVVGTGFYKNTTRLSVDETHLHVSGLGPSRLWLPTFSVPWSDISATYDDYPWGLWNSRVIRLTFARDPGIRFLVWPGEFERLTKASGGRLRLPESQTPAGSREC